MINLKALALTIMCARCEARPGEPCTTVTGGRATYTHTARTGPIHQAFGAGYDDADSWWSAYVKAGEDA